MTDLSHAWIVLELEDKTILNAAFLSQFRLDLVGISAHGTELVHGKRLAVNADARLRIEHRAAVFPLDLVCHP